MALPVGAVALVFFWILSFKVEARYYEMLNTDAPNSQFLISLFVRCPFFFLDKILQENFVKLTSSDCKYLLLILEYFFRASCFQEKENFEFFS